MILLAVLWFALRLTDRAFLARVRLAALLPLEVKDIETIEAYFDYERKSVSTLGKAAACLALLFAPLVAISNLPNLRTMLVLLVLVVVVPLLCLLGHSFLAFLRSKYSDCHLDKTKIPELRRFIAVMCLGIMVLSTLLLFLTLPLYVVLEMAALLTNAPDRSILYGTFSGAAELLHIMCLILVSPMLLYAGLIVFLPLQLILGRRATIHYVFLLVALRVILSLPITVEMKILGIVVYLIVVPFVTSGSLVPFSTYVKAVFIGVIGTGLGLLLGLLRTALGFTPLSFFGLPLAISSAILVNMVLSSISSPAASPEDLR